MKKKKAPNKQKGFVNLSTGQLSPYYTLAPNCPPNIELFCCPSKNWNPKLEGCPVDAAGECYISNALSEKLKQLTTDTEAVRAISKSADAQEQLENLLNSGNDRDVPDELFFEALKIHGDKVLFLPFARQKMARWRSEAQSSDTTLKADAKTNLKNIGEKLSFTGHERGKPPSGHIAIIWEVYCGEIEQRRIDKLKTESNLKLTIRELLQGAPEKLRPSPETIEKILRDNRLRVKITSEGLADLIVARLFDITPLTVRQYRKEAKIASGVYRCID